MENKEMEIPFGAKDSELIESTYHIPYGMEAIIEGDKVIIRKKESEDEKTRKEIYRYLYNELHNIDQLTPRTNTFEMWLAWLEKQESVEEIVERCKNSWYNEGKVAEMAEGLTDDEKYQQGWHDALEKLCANSASITKGNYSITNAEVVSHYTAIDSDGGKCTTASTTFKPKFKVGDFIVNDYCMGRVIELTNDAYLLDTEQGIPFSCEHNVHRWSIEDAKDGDVLVDRFSKDNVIILYKGINSNLSVLAYCGWNGYNLSIKTNGLGYGNLDNTNYSPATKEQCNLLFAKMKEAGYEWDAEKKELKKIHVIDEGKSEMDYCFTKMMNGEKVNPTWNEDDEEKFRDVIRLVEQGAPVQSMREHYTNWLKSLKERIKNVKDR